MGRRNFSIKGKGTHMARKRIAVLTAQADEYTQSRFLSGFFEGAFERDYDICVFSTYLKYQDTSSRAIGDSNIYNLVSFDMFDGVVLFTDRIRTPGAAEGLAWRLRHEFDGPVIVAGDESDEFESINADHRSNVEELVNHLIDVHGYKDILLLNGWEDDANSEAKAQGFLDSMERHGLEADRGRIYYGNYWYDSGKSLAEFLLQREEAGEGGLPEAVVCAGDLMAVGLATEFGKRGINVPDDIAVVGYDASGLNSEHSVPLTTIELPAYEDGRYCAERLIAAIEHGECTCTQAGGALYIGGSCGCGRSAGKQEKQRIAWDMNLRNGIYGSYHDHMLEDLLSQRDYRDFYNTLFQYIQPDRELKNFHLCMSEYWNVPEVMMGANALRVGYTKNIYRIIRFSGDGQNGAIDFDDCFDVAQLIPELWEDRAEPDAYIFTPIYFDDRCFGYAAVSYGCACRSYGGSYISWMKKAMQGMEAFYRQASLQKLLDKVNASQIRDDLTGLYNYNGFIGRCRDMCEDALMNGRQIMLMALDMKGLGMINARFGRGVGDEAILSLSQMLTASLRKADLCMRMCNDEFVVATQVQEGQRNYARTIMDKLQKKAAKFNARKEGQFTIKLCYASDIVTVTSAEALDNFINEVINQKNSAKMKQYIDEERESTQSPEDAETDRLVGEILDKNLLTYHFQPIVNARTGQIYAYEALMRADCGESISPLEIIQSADRLGRLADVEKATFVNILALMDSMAAELSGRKVFLNSIPGCRLSDEDSAVIEAMMREHGGQVVVEFTEEAEMDDASLEALKGKYASMNIETAVDDYGAGYSNVNNLLRYMPDYVKIDRMLMTNIHEDPQKQHLVKDIVEFAHDNDIAVLAEGVELGAELCEVIRLGADLIQGYYTAKSAEKPIAEIDKRIVTEMVQYNQRETTKYGKKVYVITDEDEVSMVQLAFNKYTAIDFRRINDSYRYVEMVGTPGFKSNILVTISDGFRGELRINGISLGGEKGVPCIKIGENCDVRIVLYGDNELRTGGIQVAESSRLELAGDGDLRINLASGKYFGIGGDLTSRHGDLCFNQDGTVYITATGMRGVGIGSGLGGNIYIGHGRYEIDLRGQEGVVIGCVENDCSLHIENCDMEIYNGIAHSVTIGTYKGSADIQVENVSAKISGASVSTVAIGTMYGSLCHVSMQNINISMNIRSNECYGIGCMNGATDIGIKHAYVKVVAQGREAYAMGNSTHTAKVLFANSDINTQVINSVGTDIGADEHDIQIGNGRVCFLINGIRKEREIQMIDL